MLISFASSKERSARQSAANVKIDANRKSKKLEPRKTREGWLGRLGLQSQGWHCSFDALPRGQFVNMYDRTLAI